MDIQEFIKFLDNNPVYKKFIADAILSGSIDIYLNNNTCPHIVKDYLDKIIMLSCKGNGQILGSYNYRRNINVSSLSHEEEELIYAYDKTLLPKYNSNALSKRRYEDAFKSTAKNIKLDKFSFIIFKKYIDSLKRLPSTDAIRYINILSSTLDTPLYRLQDKSKLDIYYSYLELLWSKSTKSNALLKLLRVLSSSHSVISPVCELHYFSEIQEVYDVLTEPRYDVVVFNVSTINALIREFRLPTITSFNDYTPFQLLSSHNVRFGDVTNSLVKDTILDLILVFKVLDSKCNNKHTTKILESLNNLVASEEFDKHISRILEVFDFIKDKHE